MRIASAPLGGRFLNVTVFTNLSCAALLHPSSFQIALPRRSFPSLQKARARDTTTVLSFTVFRRRLCRPSKSRSVCHAYGRSCARPWRHAAARGRLRRKILCWFVVLVFVSLGSFQQLCDSSGVIIRSRRRPKDDSADQNFSSSA